MKKIVYLSGVILYSTILNAQTNVFQCTPQNSSITQQQLVNQNTTLIQQPCVNFESSSPYNFNSNTSKTIRAINEISIKTDFHIKAVGDNSNLHLQLANKADFNVVSMNYTDLTQVLKLKKFELGITLPNGIQEFVNTFVNGLTQDSTQYINPYMEWDLKVTIELTHPNVSGAILVDGFYNQEYEAWSEDLPVTSSNIEAEYDTWGGYNLVPADYPFLIRFSPPQLGEWNAVVKIKTADEYYESESFKFTVIESGSLGYLKVGNEGRYFTLGNSNFYPLGANILWPGTQDKVTFNPGYKDVALENLLKVPEIVDNEVVGEIVLAEEWRWVKPIPRIFNNHRSLIKNIADGGGNFVRLIMHPISQDIEWEKMGDYTDRLYIAQEMDQSLEYCENRNIYVDWNLQIQNNLSYGDGLPTEWTGTYLSNHYCYKDVDGVTKPSDFFTNETVKKYYRQRLRYFMARWGYSTNIAMFELFSEINTSSIFDRPFTPETDDGNKRLPLLPEHWEIAETWHNEFATYIKSIYNGKTHLLQPSYTGVKRFNDDTFKDANIDVMASNVYPGLKTYAKNWIDHVQKEYLNQALPAENQEQYYISPDDAYNHYTLGNCFSNGNTFGCDYFIKPLFLSEYNPHMEICDANQIEVKRAIWQMPFSGAAGSLSWYSYRNGIVFPEFEKIKRFLENMVGKGGWHPGAVERKNDGRWAFREDWEDDMDKRSKKADLIYLRSDDKNYAIGVITNKTYNIETGDNGGCVELDGDFIHLNQKDFIDTRDEDLYLNGLNNGKYYITYFMPDHQYAPYISDDKNGPRIKLKTLIPANNEQYIVLFMARKTGNNWLPEQEDSIAQVMNEKLQELAQTFNYKANPANTLAFEKNSAIKIYPNPTTDILTIKSNKFGEKVSCKIMSMDGKEVDRINMGKSEILVNISALENGVYHVLIEENNNQIYQQKFIKL